MFIHETLIRERTVKGQKIIAKENWQITFSKLNLVLKQIVFIFFLSFISTYCIAQNELNIYKITSSYTSFPDTARAKGHTYNKVLYTAADHYMDSSVLIIAPKNLDAAKNVDLIFWFHGWGNNIDSAVVRYKLAKQFAASKLNAVLVLAETTKDAPDSYGGKLEQADIFKNLVNEVLIKLKKEKVIGKKSKARNVLLAGHSGAYRVMAYILQNGNVPVKEVILFDALYAETNKFLHWVQSDNGNRFIDIYTNGGGTDVESKEMVKQLLQQNITTDTLEEKDVTPQLLQTKRIVFIHSLNKHNDIINDPDNFQLFIENNSFLKKMKK